MDFIDLSAQQKVIRKKIEKRISDVLDHGQYIMGPEVFQLEEKLKSYVAAKHCISCSSGTDALIIPLMAKGIGPGDAVITTSFSYIATAEVIALTGATPIFCDIYPKTFNIDPNGLQEAYNKATSAFSLSQLLVASAPTTVITPVAPLVPPVIVSPTTKVPETLFKVRRYSLAVKLNGR